MAKSGFQITQKGNFRNLENFFQALKWNNYLFVGLDDYGRQGVAALANATPVDTGVTAASWSYEIDISRESSTITWTNSSMTKDGAAIVIMLQYGHATGTGGYVEGYDFINPSIKGIMDDIAESVWKAVVQA